MLPLAQLLLWAWIFAASFMLVLWWWQRRSGDAGIVDIGWAAGLGLVAIFFAVAAAGDLARRVLVGVMGSVWAFRLGGYLLWRNRGRPEDGRYQSLRKRFAGRAQLWFLFFFQIQATWVVLFSVPFLLAAVAPRGGLDLWDGLGAGIWLLAIGGETLADRQLGRFRRNPANRGLTCREGLWRYSRHPNYFFEWLHWFAYPLVALGHPLGWVAWGGPVLMLVFLWKVTGIPYTEKQAVRSRGESYRRYQQETSAFIPWFPKQGSS